jgi:hypothetical protein
LLTAGWVGGGGRDFRRARNVSSHITHFLHFLLLSYIFLVFQFIAFLPKLCLKFAQVIMFKICQTSIFLRGGCGSCLCWPLLKRLGSTYTCSHEFWTNTSICCSSKQFKNWKFYHVGWVMSKKGRGLTKMWWKDWVWIPNFEFRIWNILINILYVAINSVIFYL